MRNDRLTVGEHCVHFIFMPIERNIREIAMLINILNVHEVRAKTRPPNIRHRGLILVSSRLLIKNFYTFFCNSFKFVADQGWISRKLSRTVFVDDVSGKSEKNDPACLPGGYVPRLMIST